MKDRKAAKGKRNFGRSLALIYGLSALGLILLVAAAFLGPKLVFALQDRVGCGKIISMSPEEMDITAFNTGYEMDLYSRLARFAEGLARGERYYVTVQDMEITPEIRDWVDSEKGLMQNNSQTLMWGYRLIPEAVLSYDVVGWKQCVIYGEDFAGGVNFILWYIELGDRGEPVVRLLADGETGDLYGVRTDFSDRISEGDDTFTELETDKSAAAVYGSRIYNMKDYYGMDVWQDIIFFGMEFGGLDVEGILDWLGRNGYACEFVGRNISVRSENGEGNPAEISAEMLSNRFGDTRYTAEEVKTFLEGFYWTADEGGNRLDFHFPYGESGLIFRLQLDGAIRFNKENSTLFSDITIGFPEIYERIPGFTE